MAEIKNYVSKYSGDQLDAAIAVLGSLETMFFSQERFNAFTEDFNRKMTELNGDVKNLLELAKSKTILYEEIKE